MSAKVIQVLDKTGFGMFVPLVRLITWDEPAQQLKEMGKTYGLPILGITVFVLVWGLIAPRIQTSIGALPGPGEVWSAAKSLYAEHQAEKLREKEYYQQQALRKAKWEARFPEKPFPFQPYAGKPTYPNYILTSLYTVFTGFVIGASLAIPLGIICGMSKAIYTALNPLIQTFKPVSPLAWLPIATLVISAMMSGPNPPVEKSFLISAVVVALCSLWPTLINTALGVASIEKDHLNVARVLRLSPWKTVTKIVIPSSLPLIFTGLRLSLGVGWMVLIAAEMLAQNPGLGKFVWDMFQNGSSQTLAMILVAVITIGLIGFALDRIMVTLQKLFSYSGSVAAQ